MIYWELCKKLKFEFIGKLYVHKIECVVENEKQKNLWDIVIQRDHLLLPRRPDLMLIEKKSLCSLVDCDVAVDHRVEKKESEMIDKYLDLARELSKWCSSYCKRSIRVALNYSRPKYLYTHTHTHTHTHTPIYIYIYMGV